MSNMPKINLADAGLTNEEMALAEGILATQGKNKGCLRASKPKTTIEEGTWQVVAGGETAYIWRMVAFTISPIQTHHCLPVCATFDLPGSWGPEQQALAARLDDIADRIAKTVPQAWKYGGVARWANLI